MRVVSEQQLVSILGGLPTECPRVVASGNFATPRALLAVADRALPRYRLFVLNAQPGLPDRDGVDLETPFVGAGMRGSPRLRYFPSRLSLVPLLLKQTLVPDIVLLHCSTPRDGTVSMGTEVNILPAAVEAARARGGIVVAQVNPHMPYVFGDGVLACDEIDYVLEAEEALGSPVPRPVADTSRTIGERVAHMVPDGATLQLGIGAIPDAVLGALSTRRGLAVWSEMFSDGVLRLHEAGALDETRPVTASFVFGSPELYAWTERNPRVVLLRSEKTNDPGVIASHPALISVNGALEVDLYGQANASRVRGEIYSGFGGQTDFVVGALHSPGGRAVIALPSWHPKADRSTVVPQLGSVTSFQHSFIVTEQGAAPIWGHDANEQARHIVEHAAHPDARESLREAGRALGLRLS
ncbi:acetyl-CoA hydrolase/transferase C-terminal domain-containing protein [Sporichthya brevicatena]|uniref:Acetyl-CoA hydrolase/transferase C-terminal domain-containing protein n=1 Tax=Sporichthya brevicatena TaxID=171442 RepID=A0ABN1H6U3_9ACTN